MASSNTPSTSQDLDYLAREAVFDTYELVELIIGYLPTQDILLAAGVNKTWQTIATTSKSIEKRLNANLIRFWTSVQGAGDTVLYGSDSVLRDCFFTIFLRGSRIFVRRPENLEMIAVIPKRNHESGLLPQLSIINGLDQQLKLTQRQQITYMQEDPLRGLKEIFVRSWQFDFWDAHQKNGFQDRKEDRNMHDGASAYLRRFNPAYTLA